MLNFQGQKHILEIILYIIYITDSCEDKHFCSFLDKVFVVIDKRNQVKIKATSKYFLKCRKFNKS